MSKITHVQWTFHTSGEQYSGTDSGIAVEIIRDGVTIANVWVEPGNTERLDRGRTQSYYWRFQNNSGVGTAVSGQAVPYYEDFPSGTAGHLQCRFRAYGDDLWRIGLITSRVTSGEMVSTPGTIDSWKWVESHQEFNFAGQDILSTDSSEGATTLTLNY